MKQLVFTITFIFFTVGMSTAQTEKIKGNRDVTIKQTYTDDFASLEIKNDFEVKIAYNSKSSVEIEADDNLHDVINIDVTDGVLSLSTSKRITSKKKLQITINYSQLLNTITLYGASELRSLTAMELDDFSLKIAEDSRAYLNIKATHFEFTATDKSKSRLNIVADTAMFRLSDASKLDALVNSKSSSFDLYQRADATIEGDTETTNMRMDNSSNFEGENFTAQSINLLIEGSSDATVNVSELLNLEASGTTETYVFGTPVINLKTFTGSAKLQKKE
jgi:hypothetical protein